MDRGFFLSLIIGFGLAIALTYVFNWPSRRYFVDAEFLSTDDFKQKYPEKYWIGKIYPAFIWICMFFLLVMYTLIFLLFLLNSDLLPFIIPITFFPFILASDATSTGVFEVVTKISRRKRNIREVYKLPSEEWGPHRKYCYGEVVRKAGKSRILLGIMVLMVDIVAIVIVASNSELMNFGVIS